MYVHKLSLAGLTSSVNHQSSPLNTQSSLLGINETTTATSNVSPLCETILRMQHHPRVRHHPPLTAYPPHTTDTTCQINLDSLATNHLENRSSASKGKIIAAIYQPGGP